MPSRSEFDDAYDDPLPEPQVFTEEVLSEPIRHLDPQKPVILRPDATVAEAVHAMVEHRTGCVIVVEGDQLVGIFTERDLVRKVSERGEALTSFRVAEFMTPEPETLTLDDPIAFALNRMSLGGYRHVPLIDEQGRAMGIVSVRDVVRFLVAHFPKRILNLPHAPAPPSSNMPPHGTG
jgi:CBS domain-containing protein